MPLKYLNILIYLLLNIVVNGSCKSDYYYDDDDNNGTEEIQLPFYAEIGNYTFLEPWAPECEGTLVHPKWILTAAYFFSKNNSTGDKVQIINLIEDNLFALMSGDPKRKFNKILKVYIHPHYVIVPTKELSSGIIPKNNIALLELEDLFVLTADIDTIQIPKLQNTPTRCLKGLIFDKGKEKQNKIKVPAISKYNNELKYFKLSFLSFFYTEIIRNLNDEIMEAIGTPYLCIYEMDSVTVQYGILSVRTEIKQNNKKIILEIYEVTETHLEFIQKYVPDLKIYEDDPEWIKVKPRFQKRNSSSNLNNFISNYLLLLIFACLRMLC